MKNLKWKRLIWTVLVVLYFVNFFRNFFADALPGNSWLALTFFIAFTLWMAIEYYFGSPFFQSGAVHPPVLWKSLFALYYYPLAGYCVADYIWLKWTQLGFLSPVLNILGVLVFLAGTAIRLDTLRHALRAPANKLIRSGLYRVVRQPRYLGTLLQLIALPLAFSSWLGLVLALVPGLPLILAEIRAEETDLQSSYKGEFEDYARTVPALIPRRGNK